MNPYESPQPRTPTQGGAPSQWPLGLATLAILTAFFMALPGIVTLYMEFTRPLISADSFVTYDHEISFYGIDVAPSTAKLLSFTLGPMFLSIGIVLLYRWFSARHALSA